MGWRRVLENALRIHPQWRTPSSSGIAINEDTALTHAAVWAAVRGISGDVAVLPTHLYRRRSDGGKDRITDHAVGRVLRRPNSEMSAMVFRSTLQAHALLWGNAYAEIERDQAGRVVSLWPLPPDRVVPFRDERDKRLRYRVAGVNNGDVFFEPHEIIHVRGLSGDGISGYSVIRQARESIGLGLAAEKFGSTFYGNGSTFGGTLSSATMLGDKARENLRASMERHRGVGRAHQLMLLENGITFTPVGIPPVDAQFLESRKFQVTEIARWFNIPPHRIADLEKATFSNIEELNISYYTGTLLHWLETWEQEFNYKLISPAEQNIQFVEHVVEQFLRGDTQRRGEFYRKLFDMGALSPNDIRKLENHNPIEGGDRYFVAVNMQPLDQVGQGASASSETAPADRARLQIELLDPKQVERDRVEQRQRETQEENEDHRRGVAAFARAEKRQAVRNAEERRREWDEKMFAKLRPKYGRTIKAIEASRRARNGSKFPLKAAAR